MVAYTLDRRAASVGGLSVSGSRIAEGGTEALLALADGSVWRVRRVGYAPAVTGAVQVVGGHVVIGGDEVAILDGPDAAAFARHVSSTHEASGGGGVRGCLSAGGATSPLHAAVALAMARGEIGRP